MEGKEKRRKRGRGKRKKGREGGGILKGRSEIECCLQGTKTVAVN
jgi:hypothetical protein